MGFTNDVRRRGVSAAFAVLAGQALSQDLPPPPAGIYTADPSHAIIVFSVSHLGLSDFVATFDTVESVLSVDPDDPVAASVSARIPVSSIDLPGNSPEFLQTILGPAFFDAENHPEINFVSNSVDLTSEKEAMINGSLTLLGVERPITLVARYNSGYGPGVFEPVARIGFSATAAFNRSDFGMTFGVPPEGSAIGVGDEVSVQLEMEFVTRGE
jgi:polyisoprenoid-binding protein YceI